MPKKGTAGALTLFRKYVAEDDHKRFRKLVDQIFTLAECNGLQVDENGDPARDANGRPIFDPDKVHPLCQPAMRVVTEYAMGKPDQKMSVQGGLGGTKLIFTMDALPYMGVEKVKLVEENGLGETEIHEISGHTVKNGSAKANGNGRGDG